MRGRMAQRDIGFRPHRNWCRRWKRPSGAAASISWPSPSTTARTCAYWSTKSERSASAADAPDRPVAVFGDQERAVMRDGHADGTPPDLAVIDDEAGDEILIRAGRFTVLQANANDLVPGSLRPVPRTVLGGEGVATILFREIASLVE